MRVVWLLVAVFCLVAVVVAGGCGSSSATAPMCGNDDTCQSNDPVCSRGCGMGQTRLCQCGTGALTGTLVCGPCEDATPPQETGGRSGGGSGGFTGGGGRAATGGRAGGTGGITGAGGITGTGGRAGRGTGGA